MMNEILTRVALRYHAIFLNIMRSEIKLDEEVSRSALDFTGKLRGIGFTPSEELLHALSQTKENRMEEIAAIMDDVLGVNLNWAPLVKGWDVPTNESAMDHFITLIANLTWDRKSIKGTTLPCGHLIPYGTFNLKRYNGCPFCGKPFIATNYVFTGQGSNLKELRLFTEEDMRGIFVSLLSSNTPLDNTQKDSLKRLLCVFALPSEVDIDMKETSMLVIDTLVEQGKEKEAAKLMKTPTDILRYLWYKKTGQIQIIEPKTLIKNAQQNNLHMNCSCSRGSKAAEEMKTKLMLKYDRKECRRVANWLNSLPLSAEQIAENMNPKRGMWVRFIRALRLGEYSRKEGMEHLAEILDVFYNQTYTTWQGAVDKARNERDTQEVFRLLKQRPGCFARSLFSTMLGCGKEETLNAFDEVADKMPMRLLLSLGNAAELYFDRNARRIARPITGIPHKIGPNKLLSHYAEKEQQEMVTAVNGMILKSLGRKFAGIPTESKSMFIDPNLFNIPISVGDRSSSIQDTSCALMGERFPIIGDNVRLFMRWGDKMHAQHMDMDLSCHIAFANEKTEVCAYYNLTATGAKHSGDIREIPEMVGTAEYIDLDLKKLEEAGARYVTFTCNAYSCGTLTPNLSVGWMDSSHPMKISPKTGVAYDPSCVQHMVKISEENLSKGLVFGVLDVNEREIIWLEMGFSAQTIQRCDMTSVHTLLRRLKQKISIGDLLQIKAAAQKLTVTSNAEMEADESYTIEWAMNPAEVSKLLA